MSVRLRCSSWSQLVSIYRRDISRGQLFLRSNRAPTPGTALRIRLVLPSGGAIEIHGLISRVLSGDEPKEEEGGRGAGALASLEPLSPANKLSLESAVKAAIALEARTAPPPIPTLTQSTATTITAEKTAEKQEPKPTRNKDGDSSTFSFDQGHVVIAAENELLSSLRNELSTLAKLNPFQVLGVGYGADDNDVRNAFGELSKRYHPDRFVRYQSRELSVLAEELFVRARDAFKQTSNAAARAALAAQIVLEREPRKPPPPDLLKLTGRTRAHSPTARQPSQPSKDNQSTSPSDSDQRVGNAPTQPLHTPNTSSAQRLEPTQANANQQPTRHLRSKGSQRAKQDTELSQRSPLAQPPTDELDPLVAFPDARGLIERSRYTDAAGLFKLASRRDRDNSAAQAGVELAEGFRALAAGDRLEAAQRFEAVLDLHPANEVAARELAKMRRRSTNQRQGLLAKLMKDQSQ